MNRALLSSKSAEWGTPTPFYESLDALFAFTLDVCATHGNAKHPRYFTARDNGLAQSWEGETAFCNPPYGRGIGDWLRKGRDEAMHARALCAFLVPARVDTDWWHAFVMSYDGAPGRLRRSSLHEASRVLWLQREGLTTGVCFHDERIAFEGMTKDDAAPFPSAVVIHAHPSRRPAKKHGLTAGWPL